MDPEGRGTWWLLLPPRLRRLPADLAAVVAVVVVVNLSVFLPVVSDSPLRVVIGLPFILFVPGYALIAALFPEEGRSPTEGADTNTDDIESTADTDQGYLGARGIDGIERVALSFGLSIAVVPLIGLVLNFTPWGIRLVPIMIATSGFTLCATWIGARRRWALPPEERFTVPYRRWLKNARTELFDPETRTDAALNVLLAVSVVLAVSSVAFAVAVPKQGESFTEFYLLTETESGDLVADEYPTEFDLGNGREVVIGIGNHEFERVNYTVVVKLQRVAFESVTPPNATGTAIPGENVTVSVLDERELGRLGTELGHNETWQRAYEVRPTLAGERLRLAFLLYRDTVPADPSVANAYRETHLWVNVTRNG